MINPTRHMHHDVTHWPVTGSNGFGGFTFGSPVLMKGRWQETVEQFRNPQDEEEVSKAVVYLPTDVDVGDYLAEGDFTSNADPTSTPGVPTASRVRQRNRTTDLGNLVALRKVYL